MLSVKLVVPNSLFSIFFKPCLYNGVVFDRTSFPGYPIKRMLTLGRNLALEVIASNERWRYRSQYWTWMLASHTKYHTTLEWQTRNVFSRKWFSTKRASKIIVPPIEMLLSFSIIQFFTIMSHIKSTDNPIYSIVRKQTIWEQNRSTETTELNNRNNLIFSILF